jgi:hypothetical protein|tara:strand:- start:4724 stop:4942 length:219 start_codon:yes stop_codon:yes gene_type:complete
MNLSKILSDKSSCVFKDKPSCIEELKELASSLGDRDTILKKDYRTVKNIINDLNLSNAQKINKIKSLIDGGK